MGGQALSPLSSYQCFVFHFLAKGILQSPFFDYKPSMYSKVMKRGIPWQLADAGILDHEHRH